MKALLLSVFLFIGCGGCLFDIAGPEFTLIPDPSNPGEFIIVQTGPVEYPTSSAIVPVPHKTRPKPESGDRK